VHLQAPVAVLWATIQTRQIVLPSNQTQSKSLR